ncbi:unnamed protein product [Adineta ricciae]|uniref:Uncharacterized protein n=1 Tax=Adineta ricciae TaxID=249248 RepID=A0A815ERJ7_ADIRI|nr:unnamed protein product [Adineta ricciae]
MIRSNFLHFGDLQPPAARLATKPIWLANIRDGRGGAGPIYLIGYHENQAIYRTTNAVIQHLRAKNLCKVHWPMLFSTVWIPQCDVCQTDIELPGIVAAFVQYMDDAVKNNDFEGDGGNDF